MGRSIASMVTSTGDLLPRIQDRLRARVVAAATTLPTGGLVERADQALARDWPSLSASGYLDFARTGTRQTFERKAAARRDILRDLALGEAAQGEGRYVEAIADALWSTSEEASWCMPCHLFLQEAGYGLPDSHEPVVDLGVGIASGVVCVTSFLLGDKLDAVSPQIVRRMRQQLRARIIAPSLERDDFWWMSTTPHPIFKTIRINNWNPWICSNWLLTAALIEDDEASFRATVEKVIATLDRFVAVYGDDGGCPEGPAYWKHAMSGLLQCLEILSPILDQTALQADERLRNMARFVVDTRIADDYFVNFADSAPRVAVPACLVQRWANLLGDAKLAQYAQWLAQTQSLDSATQATLSSLMVDGQSMFEALANYAVLAELKHAEAAIDLPRDVWLPSLELLIARDTPNSSDGWMLSAKGGHNDNSHNHNDVGSFMVYRDGLPLIVDAGVGTYTSQTFSADRYAIWTMRSKYHNVPTIAGAEQPAGRVYCAHDVKHAISDDAASLTARLERAYPAELGLEHWTRTTSLQRGHGVTITDSFAAKTAIDASVHLLTAAQVTIGVNGQVLLAARTLSAGHPSGSGSIQFDHTQLDVELDIIEQDDPPLAANWGDYLTRIVFRLRKPTTGATIAISIF